MSALITGALLLGGSTGRATSAIERSVHADLARDLDRRLHGWRRRIDNSLACLGSVVGVVVLLYAHRRR